MAKKRCPHGEGRGCCKAVQFPSTHCTVHSSEDKKKAIIAAKKARARKKRRKSAPKEAQDDGYLEEFDVSMLPQFEDTCKLVETYTSTMVDSSLLKHGARNVVDLSPIEDDLRPLLLRITSHITSVSRALDNKRALPVRAPVAFDFQVSAAPPKSSRSNGHSTCPVHRDITEPGTTFSGLYTFCMFINTVTAENGAIKIWKGSQQVKLDPKNRNRVVSRLKGSELLTGERGCVWLFDSRLLHQSMPNATGSLRLNLVWNVSSAKVAGMVDGITFK